MTGEGSRTSSRTDHPLADRIPHAARLLFLLRRFPVLVKLRQRNLVDRPSRSRGAARHSSEPPAESRVGLAQSGLRIDLPAASEVDDGKEQVADLLLLG